MRQRSERPREVRAEQEKPREGWQGKARTQDIPRLGSEVGQGAAGVTITQDRGGDLCQQVGGLGHVGAPNHQTWRWSWWWAVHHSLQKHL